MRIRLDGKLIQSVIGAAALVAGIAMFSVPAALIAIGVLLLADVVFDKT